MLGFQFDSCPEFTVGVTEGDYIVHEPSRRRDGIGHASSMCVSLAGHTTYYDQGLAGAVAIPPNKLLDLLDGGLHVVMRATPATVANLRPAKIPRLNNAAALELWDLSAGGEASASSDTDDSSASASSDTEEEHGGHDYQSMLDAVAKENAQQLSAWNRIRPEGQQQLADLALSALGWCSIGSPAWLTTLTHSMDCLMAANSTSSSES